ncbi:MAG: Crp/Fnr family transcriptional regulator [Chitinophagaceae bacterium]|nr:Crp/Fnr family transcriptional regulator [Chitinophagaceae bacterium]
MSHPLITHVRRFVDLDEAAEDSLLSFFEPLSVPKKQRIVEEGKLCGYNLFVVKGCMRLLLIDHKGNEQTIQFAIENWWITDVDAFRSSRTASFSVQAIEDCEVLAITVSRQEALFRELPAMERYFRHIYERAYAASLFRVSWIFNLTKEAFYHHFCTKHPDFIQRIPQKMLASFLGFTPEYLSELRKKRTAKAKKR